MKIITTFKLLIFSGIIPTIVLSQTRFAETQPFTQDAQEQQCSQINENLIAPCKCLSQSEQNLPTISCITFDENQTIPMNYIFANLTQNLNQNGNSKQFEKLFVSNSGLKQFDRNTFSEITFKAIQIYETNLSVVELDTFENMADTMETIIIRSDRLGLSIFDALKPLNKLKELILSLGIHSARIIPTDGLTNMSNLQDVVLNGIAQTVEPNAFSALPTLKSIKINNQLDEIASLAFNLTGTIQSSITIDLSGNRLDETSFGADFIQANPNIAIELNLSNNLIRYLPQSVFQNFFDLNPSNTLRMTGNQFKCGACESYWIVANSSLTVDRIKVTCHHNEMVSIWAYDWSACRSSSTTNSAKGSLIVVLLSMALLLLLWPN